jgi:hypothetical protein
VKGKKDDHWLVDYSHLREQGLNDTQIAEKFGISKASLEQRFRRLNRKPGQTVTLAPVCELPAATEVEGLVEQALEDAADMITRIRDEDPHTLWVELSCMPPTRVLALVHILAAMVPANRPMSQLLAWTDELAVSA